MNEVTSQWTESETYPVLPLRDIVVFPHMIVPLFVGREKSIRALAACAPYDDRVEWKILTSGSGNRSWNTI